MMDVMVFAVRIDGEERSEMEWRRVGMVFKYVIHGVATRVGAGEQFPYVGNNSFVVNLNLKVVPLINVIPKDFQIWILNPATLTPKQVL